MNNLLYPPILSTYTPSFIADGDGAESCKVYFTIPQTNTIDEIENVQIAIRNQATNLTVLAADKYPSQIKLTKDIQKSGSSYYVEIDKEDLYEGQFNINQYYKIQLRFTSKEAVGFDDDTYAIPQGIDSLLTSNLTNFSEWSTVTIVRPISAPTVDLYTYSVGGNESTLDNLRGSLLGRLSFLDAAETSVLTKYSITIESANGDIVVSSGTLAAESFTNPNHFTYLVKYYLEEGQSYKLKFNYTTDSLYSGAIEKAFTISDSTEDESKIALSVTGERDNGRNKITLKYSGTDAISEMVAIVRSDSHTSFTIWEDLFILSYTDVSQVKEVVYDNTIEDGVFYNYGIQTVTELGARSPMKKKKPMLLTFDDAYLSTEKRQLKLEFNPTVTSYKKNVSQTKTETIGNPFPYVRKGAALDYITFSLGGMIASDMDFDNVFMSRQEVLGDSYKMYESYLSSETDKSLTHMLYEKLFREKVMTFLNSGEAFLFRSPTEGNIIVHLMDVSFTPNKTLGRSLWSFTATAVQIEETSIDNYEKHSIIPERVYTKEVV